MKIIFHKEREVINSTGEKKNSEAIKTNYAGYKYSGITKIKD